MRIHPAVISEADGLVTVSYRFETPSRPECSGELWFSLDARFRDFISAGPEAAVAALVLPAMALGEDMDLAQPVSPRFHYGIRQYVAHFHLWLPQLLKKIVLRAPGTVRAARPRAHAVVSCFSGGVDSFHTLYEHVDGGAANQDYRLTHLFYAHGFDIPLGNPLYSEMAAEFALLGKSHGLGFIGVATNARPLLDVHVPWVNTHGACLAAFAQFLSGGVGKFIIPSTNRHSLLFAPCGSNPVTDHMLGSETLEIVHHGSHVSRIQKILAIADRREVQEHLRVCWQNVPDQRNCGRCVKCLRTMMPLSLTGALDRFTVFPLLSPWNQIDRKCFLPLDLSRYFPEQSYADELLELAKKSGRRDAESTIETCRRDGAALG